MASIMPLWLMHNILWASIYIFLLICLLMILVHIRAIIARSYYTRQGVTALRGSDTFFFGNILQLSSWTY